MRESTRSQLRTILLIWAAACLTLIGGYCAALAILLFGIYEGVRSFSSDAPPLTGVVPMVLGCGLQFLLVFLFHGTRDRFEHRCWQLIATDAGVLASNEARTEVLTKQADGEGSYLADVRKRQSRALSERLRALIDQAWPDLTAR